MTPTEPKLGLNELAQIVHEIAKSKGFWDQERNDGELIALMHSELSEALEVLRYPDHAEEPIETELADCIIRILDFCAARDLDIEKAIERKIEKNKGRKWKHGKRF